MSTFRLLIDTLSEGSGLARMLMKLGRAELQEQAAKAGRGSALAAAAVLGLLVAALFILLGIVEAIIALGVAAYLAFFITGGALLLISLLVGLIARASFKEVTLRPELMLNQIRQLSATELGQRHADDSR
jgi:Putative Actinobacterial Holin-X, holin superfamily III